MKNVGKCFLATAIMLICACHAFAQIEIATSSVSQRLDKVEADVSALFDLQQVHSSELQQLRSEVQKGFTGLADSLKCPTPADTATKPAATPPASTPKPQVSVLAKATSVSAMHSHTCPNGHTWWHSDHSFGNRADHICPKCGVGPVWTQDAAVSSTRYTVKSSSGSKCPGGVCPRPSSGFRLFRR